jgi:hypothetical protein
MRCTDAIRQVGEVCGVPLPDLQAFHRRLPLPAEQGKLGRFGQIRQALIGINNLINYPGEKIMRGIKLRMTPFEAEVMAVKGVCDNTTTAMPEDHTRVIISRFIKGQDQIGLQGLGLLRGEGPAPLWPELPEGLHPGAQGQELAGGEKVRPSDHPIIVTVGGPLAIRFPGIRPWASQRAVSPAKPSRRGLPPPGLPRWGPGTHSPGWS